MAENEVPLPAEVQQLLKTFVIPRERLVKLSEDIEAEFQTGLEGKKTGNSSIPMLPSYVPALPTGEGQCYHQVFLAFFWFRPNQH